MAAAFAQTSPSLPQFEGADVHASPHESFPLLNGPFTSGGLYKVRSATMVDLIHLAYNVDADRVMGGPTWLELDRFDVIAKVLPGTTSETRRSMLRALLAERFHLVAHPDTQPMRASALRQGPHPQLKPAAGAAQAGCGYFRPSNRPTPTTMELRCHSMTMTDFAEQIRNIARQGRFWSPLPVVDQTGLQGAWDFEFQYDVQMAALDDNVYLSQILEKQIGLKLEDIRMPAPVIEVQSVDRTPTPNSPDLAKIIPPLPAEFDAAEIKPADVSPGARQNYEFKNGRVYMPGVTVAYLIETAWNVTGTRLAGLPKWAESDQVDFIAKAPPEVSLETTTTQAGFMLLDMEPLRPMLRALLMDLYKLQVHTEDRPMPAYVLEAVKPKLAKADPSSRTACHDGPPSALGMLETCENMTMAQFANALPLISRGDVHDVFDATGLEGAWRFSFNFVGLRQLNAARAARSDGDAADPAGRYTIFDAVSKQLGLKLEAQKRPLPVLVIDHIEQNKM
jgi:uncharacterized protein (TIGR03435 family)